jgi:hypothetical protein
MEPAPRPATVDSPCLPSTRSLSGIRLCCTTILLVLVGVLTSTTSVDLVISKADRSLTFSSSCQERHRMTIASTAYWPLWTLNSVTADQDCWPSQTCRARAPSTAGYFPWLDASPSWIILPSPRSSRYDALAPCENQCLNPILSLPLSSFSNFVFCSYSGKCNAVSCWHVFVRNFRSMVWVATCL